MDGGIKMNKRVGGYVGMCILFIILAIGFFLCWGEKEGEGFKSITSMRTVPSSNARIHHA